MELTENTITISCGRCDGGGHENGSTCPICRGIGTGKIYGSLFLYWGRRIDVFAVFLESLKNGVNAVTNFILALLGLLGFAMLALHASRGSGSVLSLAYWHDPHPRLLLFWFGVLCLGMLYYRLVAAATRRKAVRFRTYGEEIEELRLPTDDSVWEAVRALPKDRRIDVSAAYSRQAIKAVNDSFRLARKLKHGQLMPAHLFGSLIAVMEVGVMLVRLGLKFDMFNEQFGKILVEFQNDEHATVLSGETESVLIDAYIIAYESKEVKVDPTELFLATVQADQTLQDMLFEFGVDARKVGNVVKWNLVDERLRNRHKRFSAAARLKPKGAMNRAMTSMATPYLDTLSSDLTTAAKFNRLAPVVAREKEFEALFRAIEGGRKSVILAGHQGVGKNAIIEGLAQRMVEEDVPKILQDQRLVSLNLPQLVSGATPAEAQERLLTALYEVGRSGNIVLAVNDVGGMVGITAGSGESIDLSKVFAQELSRGYFFAICTSTPREYVNAVEGSALGEALIKIVVGEPDVDEAIHILESKVGGIGYTNGVFFSYDAVEKAVQMSDRYMHERYLPEKSIEVAREVAQAVRKNRGAKSMVGGEDVAAIVSEKTNIPLTALTEEQSEKLLKLEEKMHERIIGQDQAVSAVASAMRRAGADLREKERPIANFLFLGPTGVGKTELAKTLAENYFGSEDSMIRLDMSEYQDKAAIYKMIGEPAGDKVGGVLSEAVRKQPFSLVLLDELEKAHPDILTLFLQVMDDGRLSDNTGRVIDFTNVILIATSNAGAHFIQDAIKRDMSVEGIKERLLGEHLKDHFRPEFINRFDDVIVFTPIQPDELLLITKLMLKKVSKRLEEKGIYFEVTDGAVQELSDEGYDPLYGARPLRRVIQDKVDTAIADALLKGEIGRKDTVIYDVGGEIRVERA
ncbi:MAG: ATP-dependent Clp protease ATP-binding subunit [Patescibacteria group bacterium]|nr:ATP-dependent Clp protease ATP-binding subunit [Patescibacteria group bacterium]